MMAVCQCFSLSILFNRFFVKVCKDTAPDSSILIYDKEFEFKVVLLDQLLYPGQEKTVCLIILFIAKKRRNGFMTFSKGLKCGL